MLRLWTMFDKPVHDLWLIGLMLVLSGDVKGQEMIHVGELHRDIINASLQRAAYLGIFGQNAVLLGIHNVICPPTSCKDAALHFRENFMFLSDIQHSLGGCCQFCACQTDCDVEENVWHSDDTERLPTAASVAMDTECISPQIWSYTSDHQVEAPLVSPIVMVNTCHGGDILSNEGQKCTNPNPMNLVETTPATSLDTGTTYWNLFCARCNGDNNILLWDPVLHIPAQLFVHNVIETAFPRFRHILDELLHKGPSIGNITYSAPDSLVFVVQQQVCVAERQVIDACNMTGLWLEDMYDPMVEEACLTKKVKYEVGGTVYRNFFCFLCNAGTVPSMRGRVSRPCNISLVPSLPQQGTVSGRLNMAAVGSGDSGSDVTKTPAGYTDGLGCVWDPYKVFYRPVYCARGNVVINCTCVPVFTDISGLTMALKMRIYNTTKMQGIFEALKPDSLNLFIDGICEEVSKRIYSLLKRKMEVFGHDSFIKSSNSVPIASIVCISYLTSPPTPIQYSELEEVIKTALSPLSVAFKFWFDSVGYMSVYQDASLFFAHDHVGKPEVVDSADGIPFASLYDSNPTRFAPFQDISKLLFCHLIELDENEFVMINKAKLFIIANRKVIAAEFYKFGSRVRVCLEDYLDHDLPLGSQSGHCVHPVAIYISLLCIFALFFRF